MTCKTFGIRDSGVVNICEASISIFHLDFIGENDSLDIVIIWRKISCPQDYHYIQYVVYVYKKFPPSTNNILTFKDFLLSLLEI